MGEAKDCQRQQQQRAAWHSCLLQLQRDMVLLVQLLRHLRLQNVYASALGITLKQSRWGGGQMMARLRAA
jgi:hypothetical protein